MHIPVLQKEIIQYLDPKPNENFIDCTMNGGGHALAILEKTAPDGKLLGMDWDREILRFPAKQAKLKARLKLVNDNFVNLKEVVKKEKFGKAQGTLLDLGLSSWHLEESGRGFSFLRNEPLDMRYNPENPITAEKILNYWSVQEIEKILKDFGEERFAREIARSILKFRQSRPLKTTFQLLEIVKTATPNWYQQKRVNPATKTFQALRIAVNDELKNLEKVLPQALDVLKPGGKIAIISFHSLEDRIVKSFFREKEKENLLKILTKKPVIPQKEEVKINPRSRSAKLRVAQKNE